MHVGWADGDVELSPSGGRSELFSKVKNEALAQLQAELKRTREEHGDDPVIHNELTHK